MINKPYKEAIEILNSKFLNQEIEWYLTGKISLALQGMNVQPKNIGVLINEEDLDKAREIFSNYNPSEVIELSNKEAKEFSLEINKIPSLFAQSIKMELIGK